MAKFRRKKASALLKKSAPIMEPLGGEMDEEEQVQLLLPDDPERIETQMKAIEEPSEPVELPLEKPIARSRRREVSAGEKREELIEQAVLVPVPPKSQSAGGQWLKKHWFLAMNAIYGYLYFVGLHLLHSTRMKRRQVRHLFHQRKEMRTHRRKKRQFHLRTRLRAQWRELISPFTELRAQVKDFSRVLKNTRKYGTAKDVLREILGAFCFWLFRLWKILKTLLNYLAPIAACVLLYLTVQYFSGLELALRVEYNGVDVGCVTDEAVFTRAEKDMKARMILDDVLVADPTKEDIHPAKTAEIRQNAEQTEQQAKTIRPRFELTAISMENGQDLFHKLVKTIDPTELVNEVDLTDRLIRAVSKGENNPNGFAVEEADGLYIDNTYVGAVRDGAELLDLLNQMREKYRTSDMNPDVEIEFVKKIQVRHGLYPSGDNGSIRSLDGIESLLSREERGRKIYTVVTGDDPLTIAAKNEMTLEELEALNPEVTVSLFPGDELLIANSVPYLGVKVTETIRYEEEIEYEIIQKTDPSRMIGYTKVEEQGEKGLREVTAKIVRIDGMETERNIINTNVLKEATSEIVTVGGNRPLKVIPTNSSGKIANGAFGWPTVAGTINPGFRGYYGHTGSDISWGGCYGSPILASADGTVVSAGWAGAYGYCVVVDHGAGMQTLYAHASKLYVAAGQQVKQGEIISAIGQTGNASGPHLHFEMRINGTPVDAAPYLYG